MSISNAVVGPQWIDDAGRRARDRLRVGQTSAVIGHGDWYAGNLRFEDDRLVVVHDWDSVIADSESTLVGFAAAVFPTTNAGEEATVAETEAFLAAYAAARGRRFSADERERSWAAGVWLRAFDSKKQHALGQPVRSLTEQGAPERLRRAGAV
jgi:aminoglycoside phosphotransferase (APT) family kinase protein